MRRAAAIEAKKTKGEVKRDSNQDRKEEGKKWEIRNHDQKKEGMRERAKSNRRDEASNKQ